MSFVGSAPGLIPHSPAKGIELPRRETSLESLCKDEAGRLLLCPNSARESESLLWWSRRWRLRWRCGSVCVAARFSAALARHRPFKRQTNCRAQLSAVARRVVRHLPLPASIRPPLRDWQSFRSSDARSPGLSGATHDGNWGMSSRRASHGLRSLLAAAKCQPLSRGWHALRHTFASQFVMQGGNILTLQNCSGTPTLR